MQLDLLSVDLRRRNGWETLDLGLAMLREWRRPVLRAWCMTYWPYALLVGAATWTHPLIGAALVWWAKPVFDRVLLYVYSERVFGHRPTAAEVRRMLPRLLRSTRLLAGLTLYRFSMARSLFLPVWQLEGQRGRAASARRRVLGARGYGYAAWLTFFCANLIGILVLSGMVLILMFLPPESDFLQSFWQILDSDSLAAQRSLNLLTFIADTIVEPYFVAAGFSLYLNRRSELEGWDIEVAFRRMAARGSGAHALAATLLVAAIAVCLASIPASTCFAQSTDQKAPDVLPPSAVTSRTPYPAGDIARRAAEVLTDPVFGPKETEWHWVYRGKETETQTPSWLRDLIKWLERFSGGIAEVGRVLAWIAGVTVLALVIYLVARHRERWWTGRRRRRVPETLFGLDIRRESLPADIGAAAREHLSRGDAVGALSLLYRGALSALVHAAGVDFRPGDTERDCWQRARPVLGGDGLLYFRSLLDAWLWAAYGRRPPAATELQRLCDAWRDHLGDAALARALRP